MFFIFVSEQHGQTLLTLYTIIVIFTTLKTNNVIKPRKAYV